MSKADALTAAVQAVDLPALIAEMFPDSKAKPGKAGVAFASWRGNTDTEALSISKKGQVWLWHDMATDDGGNAFDFLTGPGGMAKQEAATYLLKRAGIPDQPQAKSDLYRPIPESDYKAFLRPQKVRIASMAGRGFNAALLARYRIIPAPGNPDDALIPITSPEGVVLQVKRRYHQGRFKYGYEHKGYGSPPWCSDGSRQAPMLYIIEGELNAIIAHAALEEAGEVDFGVMGVAGAKNAIFDGLAQGKHVFVSADHDEPGHEAVDRWQEEAREQGARSVYILPPQPKDFCDYAGENGRPALASLLASMRQGASQVYGPWDRMIGRTSVRELVDSAKRYISGEVLHPTGFKEIDRETGGIRDVGLFGIGGLSSMGKSALLRRMALEEVRAGGIVRIYSPDQSPHANYRLIASLLSDVGSKEARTRRFCQHVLDMYGSPEAALKAWMDAYSHVIREIAPRFQVIEEGSLREISKDMERAVDQGVTMFGVDYIQMLEPEGSDSQDGLAATQLQKIAQRLNRPVLTAMQLAKYKFPATRKSGLPASTDIQGAGAYFHSLEMLFLVYNDEIYRAKYAGPDLEGAPDPPGTARILLRKDKEGDGDIDFEAMWISRLAAFRDFSRPSVKAERKGLMG